MSVNTSAAEASQPRSAVDLYPSRASSTGGFIERTEPVVYAPDKDDGLLARRLVDQYEEQGFFVLENVFNAAETRVLQEELARLHATAEGDRRIEEPGQAAVRSIFAIHKMDSLFSRLPRDRRLLEIAQFLLHDEVYIHQSRLNYKPGFRGREFYWHSDFETWHVEDGMPAMRALSMFVTLTENTPNNGPLMLIPGSHKQYVSCAGETPDNHFRRSLRKQEYGIPADEMLAEMTKKNGIVTADAPPGSVIVFDSNLMHGSNGNITPYPRSNAFFVYNAMSNRVLEPFCAQPPRPEYLCTRAEVSAVQPLEKVFPGE